MRLTVLAASIVFLAPAFPQHLGRLADAGRSPRPVDRKSRSALSFRAADRSAVDAAAIGQAPGVVQTNLLDASNVVWFVTAEKLPQGSQISPILVFPDGFQIPLDAVTLTQDVAPGTSYDLPNIRNFGSFWPQGLLTYVVVVTVNGKDTQTAADFPVGSSRNFDDVAQMVPRISSLTESLSNRDVLLSIKGSFTSDPPYVLLEDIVAPRTAVQVAAGEIVVNLSKIRGLDLSIMQDSLVTVGQSGWCDTAIFRHTPTKPGTYNPTPQ